MTAQAPQGHSGDGKALVERYRAEHGAQEDRQVQAMLLHECGAIEETIGEEPLAARDHLAAFNLDPHFREPLEALVRILTRRKSIKNLGKLLEALTRAAETPEERARAFTDRAAYLQDYESDLAAARECLDEAVNANPEDPLPWIELEMLAAKEGDTAARMHAIEARAQLAADPTWKALLYIELAELAADNDAAARSYELLDAAGALDGRARFRSRQALEALATRHRQDEELVRALESQAELIVEAIEDAAQGDATGVPRSMRRPEHAADAWLRASEIRARQGDRDAATALLDRALAVLPGSSVLTRAKLASLEAAGATEDAARLAKEELARGGEGPGAASLWLRVAEAAMVGDDRAGALDALARALEADPGSIPARALQLDLLGDDDDQGAFASALEGAARSYGADAARARGHLLAALVWATKAGNVAAAKSALAVASSSGSPDELVARIARSLAAIAGDAAWYEEATSKLLAAGVPEGEQPSLWFEIGRSRLLRGDEAGAAEAFVTLAACGSDGGKVGPAAWLGRVLGAYAIGLAAPAEGGEGEAAPRLRSPQAIEQLAEVEDDAAAAAALRLVAALRMARAGDIAGARARLGALHEASAGDEVVALFLAELSRRAGDVNAAAAALSACAVATEDNELGGALHLEAAILLWRAGERSRAISAMEAAQAGAPKAAAIVLAWALCGVDADTLDGRRRALDVAQEAGGDAVVIALDRFGLEVAADGGDAAEAATALEAAEAGGYGDIALAAALGRLVHPPSSAERDALERALDKLEERGGAGAQIARAERYRLTRTVDQDRALAATRAEEWSALDAGAPVALEWLGAALAAEDREAEVAARRAVARTLEGAGRAAMDASATLVASLDQAGLPQPLLEGEGASIELMNLELALPGCDPRRRAAALRSLGASLGDEAQLDALSLAGWSDLAGGAPTEAVTAFRAVVEARPDDVAAWEGVRASSGMLGDHVSEALACAQLGALSASDERGAELWERAGLLLLDKPDAHDDAHIAFERAFDRDSRRGVAFDKLFRRVRAAGQDDKLLAIVARRLDVAEDETEVAKLFWERARALRKKGDRDAALAALEDVTMLEPDHVGALALAGEIQITKGDFAKAAPLLARLATIEAAPAQQRLMSGVAAVDLYEKRLHQPDKALEVLVALHRAGLATAPVRERLAASAAKNGAWTDATAILEQLMNERDKPEGRIEAARLAMAIWRDKVDEPVRAQAAVTKLLDEAPDDGEAIDLVLATTGFDAAVRTRLLARAKTTLVQRLGSNPCDEGRVALLAKIAGAAHDSALRQATLGALLSLGGGGDGGLSRELVKLDGRVAARPEIRLDETALAEISDPADEGPVAELFAQIAETVGLALGPSLMSLGVTKKDRIDSRGGHPLRLAVASWMGALGFDGDFELYIGGRLPRGVSGVAGSEPAMVLGSEIAAPLDVATRSAIAREVFALRRGITAVRTRDDNTVASIVVACCIEAGLQVPAPQYAVFGEVSRGIHKELPSSWTDAGRRVRKALPEICQRIVAGKHDPQAWAGAARRSLDRMAIIAAGDASVVLSDVLGVPIERLAEVVSESDRAVRLLGFVLSPSYLDLRRKLGMGVR